jgi:hypothetical protein
VPTLSPTISTSVNSTWRRPRPDPLDLVGLVGGDGVLLSTRADNGDHDST